MHSLIAKISHSTVLKDVIGVARGVYKVAASQNTYSRNNLEEWTRLEKSQKQEQHTHKPISINRPNIQQQNKVNAESTIKQSPILETYTNKSESKTESITKKNQSKEQAISQNIKFEAPKEWTKTESDFQRTESKVISSRFGRFREYGKLGRQLVGIEVEAFFARRFGGGNEQQIYERGAHKITQQLCKMRGAPLKVAQMLSIQQDNLIPAPIRKAFEKAREKAHVMPQQQVKEALSLYLGSSWQQKFRQFTIKPFAAASIGQVHKAISLQGQQLAVKLQYPGVEKSIHSDMNNLKLLLKLPGVMPKGIFIDKLLANTQKELRQQCDYTREAQMQRLYDKCLSAVMGIDYQRFGVPKVNQQLSARNILVSQFLSGVGVSRFQEEKVPQHVRDEVGRLLMKLTFSEIFELGVMQSDPNPSNFTFNIKDNRLNLFDFGATHVYDSTFLQNYCGIIQASVEQNRALIIQKSIAAGFLTNEENKTMLDNHVESILVLGQPLRSKGLYDFGNQNITERIYRTIPQMLKNRLKSPPEQIYSLHRKLSGAYLSCIRMKSRVDCGKIFENLQRKRAGEFISQVITSKEQITEVK